jgi:CubicO group peptidase (beta-lactamase class C family)
MKPFLLPLFLFLSLLASAQSELPDSRIDHLAQQYVANPHNRGLLIGIVRKGTQTVLAYGETEKGNKQVPKVNDMFEVGELSGVFTTTLLARMLREGTLSLDMPLDSLMPSSMRMPMYQALRCEPKSYINADKAELYVCEPLSDDQVTLLRLCDIASHTAGLPHKPGNIKAWLHPANPFVSYSRAELYTFLNNYPVRVTQGFGYRYSYIGMALVGEALTNQGARTYEDVLLEKLVYPLAMHQTGVHLTPVQRLQLLPGHNRRGKPVLHQDWDVLAPAAGICSSMQDMLTLLSIHLGFTSDDWFHAAKLTQNPRVRVSNLPNTYAGLSWLITPFPETGEEIIWQAGQTGGFACYAGLLPEAGIGIVLLSNSANSVQGLGLSILRSLNRPLVTPVPFRAPVSGPLY